MKLLPVRYHLQKCSENQITYGPVESGDKGDGGATGDGMASHSDGHSQLPTTLERRESRWPVSVSVLVTVVERGDGLGFLRILDIDCLNFTGLLLIRPT